MIKFEDLTEEQKQTVVSIQQSVPQEWMDNLMTKEKTAPVVREMLEKAIADHSVPKEKREEYQLILDSGYVDMETEVVRDDVSGLIDAYIEKELTKAIIAKKLPQAKERPKFEVIYKRYKQLKENYDRTYNISN